MLQTFRHLRPVLLLLGAAGASRAQMAPIGSIISEQSRTAFSIQGAGARALGLGGAFIALADDATAVSFNPAGLAQMLRPEASLVGRGINRGVAFQDAETTAGSRTLLAGDSLISNTRFDPLLAAATVPLRVGGRTLAIQLSVQRIFPLGEGDSRDLQEQPADGSPARRLRQDISQDGQIDLYSFAAAYEVSQRVLLGLSANLWRGAWSLSSRSTSTSAQGSSYLDFGQTSRFEGANFNLGLLWRWPTWSLGITRRTGFHADYTYATRLATSARPDPVASQPYTTGLHWPSTTGVGFAYRPSDRWLVTADVVSTPWSDTRYMSGRPALDGVNFFNLNRGGASPDATQVHLGVEHLFLPGSGRVIPLRLGWSREPQPVTDRLTGQQRVIQSVSAGTGLKRGAWTFDVAYRYGWGRRAASQFLDPEQILSGTSVRTLGTETLTEHRVDLSLIVQFDRSPVQDLLHHLFVGD
ncbi:OmpP1/FadL family transporter [Mesoterricola sediminis]|uniref:Long-chain fatty acid transport protein n=1 Tax=Mesoterricola sediminis TaxID=2927980 RepID=A0AA48KC77_9BACT|nr:outer membrane protein transport protein [Mesoterricola sediminis]BDU75067.1 hypothetical protein METESE_00250 [Mesoterricola sediminis]